MSKTKNEEAVVNDAIQYWRGFEDALNWSIFFYENSEEIKEQLLRAAEMIEIYRDRLRKIKADKITRRNKPNKLKHKK